MRLWSQYNSLHRICKFIYILNVIRAQKDRCSRAICCNVQNQRKNSFFVHTKNKLMNIFIESLFEYKFPIDERPISLEFCGDDNALLHKICTFAKVLHYWHLLSLLSLGTFCFIAGFKRAIIFIQYWGIENSFVSLKLYHFKGKGCCSVPLIYSSLIQIKRSSTDYKMKYCLLQHR